MKKIMLTVVLLLALILPVSVQASESFRVYDYRLGSDAGWVLQAEHEDFRCAMGFMDDGEVVIARCLSGEDYTDRVVVQVLPERINGGYYIIIIHSECNGTFAVAYNPDAEKCRIFCDCDLFMGEDK